MRIYLLTFITCLAWIPFMGEAARKLDITVSYERQAGRGSNQYAVWVEDAAGNLVKTLYVTKFTAAGGYHNRPACCSVWVQKANAPALSETEVDGFTGATPSTGDHTYSWDLTDTNGQPVAPGTYTFVVEANLLGDSKVFYKGNFETEGTQALIDSQPEYTSDDPQNRELIRRVTAHYKPE